MPDSNVFETQALTSQCSAATPSSESVSGLGCGRVTSGPPPGRRASPSRVSSILSGGAAARRITLERPASILDRVLSKRLAQADRPAVGAVLSSLWTDVDGALRPFVGPAGVAALLARSLRATARRHDWLADLAGTASAEPDVGRLALAFDSRERGEATAASLSLLRSFCGVLSGAVGASLAERLLQPVVATSTILHDARPCAITQSM